jgi:amino acid adenylation domain-containing protein
MPENFNYTETDYSPLCLHQLFESQVERTPDTIAVVFENQQLSYRSLNARANQVAHYLKKFGVEPEVLVGICVERSVEMIVGLLGILKAGGAYVPLVPTYPKARLTFMLSDSQATVLLTQEKWLAQFSEQAAHVLCLDADWEKISQESDENPVSGVTPDNLAYLIYTSGTTGVPKGVAIEHRSVLNLATALSQSVYANYKNTQLRISLNGSLAFDTSVKQIIQLLYGYTIDIIPESIRFEGTALLDYLKTHQIDVFDCTPSQLELLIAAGLLSQPAPKIVLIGGEPINESTWKTLVQAKNIRFYNLYGPTECTVDATICEVQSSVNPVIGHPLANVQIELLDQALQPVPVGEAGELHIGGAGLARGYLNRPELTAEKFILKPNLPGLKDLAGLVFYKTGDLARYLPDGSLEFLGRTDDQIKLRGFRIELGEIAAVLEQHPEVREAVVTAPEIAPGDKRLVAYFIDKKLINISKLRYFLQDKLPNHMIPAAFVRLDKMPLTPNGKIDRKALPLPTWEGSDSADGLPSTSTEINLFKWWSNVLGVSQFSIHDNFFELGGHSLLATRIISRVHETFKIDISISTLFDNPTVATLAELIDSLVPPSSLNIPSLEKGNQEEVHTAPLSITQQSFWLFEQLHPNTPTFNIPFAFKLTGILNFYALEQAFSEMVHRHATLRTHFEVTETGAPRQRIIPPAPISVTVIDLSGKSEIETQQAITEEIRRPFNLGQAHLWRATVLRQHEQEQILLLIFHHLITDGWSRGLFIDELIALYAAFSEDATRSVGEGIPSLRLGTRQQNYQYTDFCRWQEKWLQGEQYQSQLAYWQSQLKGPLPVLELPTDYPRPPMQTYQGARQPIIISPTLSAALYKVSHQQGVTLFMTLLAAFKVLLYRYTGQTDLSVGTAAAGRQRVEWENVIGLFINNLVLRTTLSGQTPFVSFLSQVREVALAAYNHQDLPFKNLIDSLHPERDLSHNLLFQTFFLLQNFDFPELKLDGLTTTPLNVNTGTVKFDLTLELYEKAEGITGWFEYNIALFSAATMQRMVGHFQILLESIIAAPETPLSSLRILTEAERHPLERSDAHICPSNAFNAFTKADIEQSISERFEQQVSKYPDHIAVQTKHGALTYFSLNERANQVAQTLLKACEDGNIALLFEHEISMIVGIFGVLKAGLTYVPLAPDLPTQRLIYILQDSQASVLLTNSKNWVLAQELRSGVPSVINIDEPHPNIQHEEKIRLFRKSVVLPDTLAYILYTSGSEGQPKGVMQNHRNVLHFIRNYTNKLHINADDKLTLLSAYGFDAAVMDIFGALLNGATLYPINIKEDSLANPVKAFIKEQGITIYHSTPTVYRHIISTLMEDDHFPKLRLIVLGGEEVYKSDVDLYKQHFSENCIFINGLGPTESSVSLQYFINKQTSNSQATVPIGYPVDDTDVLLLNEAGEKTELYGEIALKSAYVALGYWRKTDITKAAFSRYDNQRLYHMGDMGRLRADGSLEFAGRKDAQVKLRGYRIELGEIQTILNQHPAVQESRVIVWEDSSDLKRLVAYVVPSCDQEELGEELRRFLKDKLPDYMVPSTFVILDKIPLLPNGKVDRRHLPIPEIDQKSYCAPRNALERQLAKRWEKVLGIKSIGIHDSFFDLGGHSLLAVTLLSQIEKRFDKHLPLITLFKAPTIAQLTAILTEEKVPDERCILEVIQPQGNRPPFFFVGSTNYARAIAPILGDNQPVYGLNLFGLQPPDGTIPFVNVKNIAKQYCQEIQTVQPEGPYYLCGYCADAKVAFEIAQQLHAQEKTVALLAFIDVIWQPQRRYFDIYRHWHNFLEMGFSYLSHKVRQRFNYTKTWLRLSFSKRVETFYRHTGKTSPRQLQDLQFINRFYTALNNYKPEPYSGHITLFLSRDWCLKDSTVFYKLADGLEIYEVAGYHDNLFDSPQVEELGKQLKRCLEEKQQA